MTTTTTTADGTEIAIGTAITGTGIEIGTGITTEIAATGTAGATGDARRHCESGLPSSVCSL
jgi:hypothetical protein